MTRYTQPQHGPLRIDEGFSLAARSGLWLPDKNVVTGKDVGFGGSGGNPSVQVVQDGTAIYTNGKWLQTDLPAVAFSALTWIAVIRPDAAPTTASFSAFFQTGQITLNWNHGSVGLNGSMTLYNGGAYPTCKFVNGFVPGAEVIIAGTYDGTTLRVYRGPNAVLENSTAAVNSLSGVSVNSLQFLGGQGGTAPWAGFCRVFHWDQTRALAQEELALLMRNLYQQIADEDEDYDDLLRPASGGATTHATSGALVGQGATMAGSAQHKAKHTTSGALTGQLAGMAGTARRFRSHATSGAPTGAGSAVAGSAAHKVKHTSSGTLAGPGSVVNGSAARAGAGPHPASGALVGLGSQVAGAAAVKRRHTTSGALVGPGALLQGMAVGPKPVNNWLGGPKGRRKKRHAWDYTPSAEEVQRQRVALGILPAPPAAREPIAPAAKKVIRDVAKRAAEREISDDQAQAWLQQALQRQHLAQRTAHADLMLHQRNEMRRRAVALALARQQAEDDELAAHILLG